jgi:hypothetical protein
MTEQHHNEHNGGFERQDLGSKPIYGFLISLVVIGVAVYYTIWGVYRILDKYNLTHQPPVSPMAKVVTDTRSVDTATVEATFPQPRLEVNERTELNDYRLKEEQTLNSYGWVDQSDGVARIPITKAMELIAQRGLPVKPQVAAPAGTSASGPSNHSAGKQTKGKK